MTHFIHATGIVSQVGTAYINCCAMVEPNMPWSGRKGSGLGVILSAPAIRDNFTRPKSFYDMTI
jgi:acyl-CoA reductase-like NAD-dependent aldehyde dehydrogenase